MMINAIARLGTQNRLEPSLPGSAAWPLGENEVVGYALERMGWLHFEQLCAALLE
jgi:hypothetical protein